ncbi:hypothetical protein M3226_19235 [Neobacillus cucumis]|uniref:hypothetical protein n=1 Tax=Neobacillus cucumis TaxID=1740721 RepID=UPI00203DD03C|nr:hypothetical protein [Neobacillus cucumis]MCM3727797.1 hypothetical protein [Neobacillus cucumis]
MKETFYLKLNVYLLLTIIPLSVLGYYFAVLHESMFFLYEWLLAGLVLISIFISIKNIVSIRSGLKWVAISILAFLLQFSVLGLFLGPYTYFLMIYLYYVVAILSFIVYIVTMRKSKTFKTVPIIFTILTGLFTLYMVFLDALWGSNLS